MKNFENIINEQEKCIKTVIIDFLCPFCGSGLEEDSLFENSEGFMHLATSCENCHSGFICQAYPDGRLTMEIFKEAQCLPIQ